MFGRRAAGAHGGARREGARIAEMLEKRNKGITALTAGSSRSSTAPAPLPRTLARALATARRPAEPERLEQEIALVAQRADVAEEIDRLASHVVESSDPERNEPSGGGWTS